MAEEVSGPIIHTKPLKLHKLTSMLDVSTSWIWINMIHWKKLAEILRIWWVKRMRLKAIFNHSFLMRKPQKYIILRRQYSALKWRKILKYSKQHIQCIEIMLNTHKKQGTHKKIVIIKACKGQAFDSVIFFCLASRLTQLPSTFDVLS